MRGHLGPRLFAGTEKSKNSRISAGKVFACDSAGGTDPHGGTVMIVHQRQNLAGVHVEEHDETDIIAGINATLAASDLYFLRKAGIDAQRHRLHAWHKSHDVVEIVLPAFFLPRGSEPGARRIHSNTLTQFAKGLLDGIDLFSHGEQVFHLIVLEN